MPDWYKDAIFYEVHVKAFMDGDGNGVGDFRGLTERLDYLRDLGVTCLWILPMYPSPLRDDGYDIADFYGIHPTYGTVEDFQKFLDAAHAPGLPLRRRALPGRARGHELREPSRHPRHPQGVPPRDRCRIRRLPRAPGRGQPVAGGRASILRRRRRVPHGLPLPAHAPALHGRTA